MHLKRIKANIGRHYISENLNWALEIVCENEPLAAAK
jgi:hypothetical protein